jgi:hypothetical protein
VAVVCGAVSAWAWWLAENRTTAGMSLRIGLLFGAVWFAYPGFTSRSVTRVAMVVGLALLVLLRPRLIWLAVPALVVWGVMTRRR